MRYESDDVDSKIALTFAREKDVPLTDASPALRFLRGKSDSRPSVGPVHADVVTVENDFAHPLTHGVYLFTPPDATILYACVTLFEAFQFVVVLDENARDVGWRGRYRYSIVHAEEDKRQSSWHPFSIDLERWLRTPVEGQGHVEAARRRAEHAEWWLKRRKAMRIERAMATGARAYEAKRATGASHEDATEAGEEEANRVLKEHGLSLKLNSVKTEIEG